MPASTRTSKDKDTNNEKNKKSQASLYSKKNNKDATAK